MADTIFGKKIKELPETELLNDDDDILVEDATPKTKRIKISSLVAVLKEKLGIEDTGWKDFPLTSSFVPYADSQKPQYRKIGNIVQLRGAVKPASSITGSNTQHTICTLPAAFRPGIVLATVQHGSSANKWLLQINPDGKVSFSRLTNNGSWANASTSEWLAFNTTFFVD